MIAVVLFVMIIVLMMLIKNITEPLQHMIETAQKISKGDLSCTIEISSNNELVELGNVINEMSSNIQEITLLSKNLYKSGDAFAVQTASILSKPEIEDAEIESLRGHLDLFESEFEMLDNVISCFNFYSLKDSSLAGLLLLSTIPGIGIGVYASTRFPNDYLKLLLGLIMLTTAFLFVSANQKYENIGLDRLEISEAWPQIPLLTFMAVASGMLSVSIGEWLVPLMQSKWLLKMSTSVATSITVMFGTCVVGTLFHLIYNSY